MRSTEYFYYTQTVIYFRIPNSEIGGWYYHRSDLLLQKVSYNKRILLVLKSISPPSPIFKDL